MGHTSPLGEDFRAVRPGQARELVAAFRWAQYRLDRLVVTLERAGLGDAVITASVIVDDTGQPIGQVAMTVDGVVRLANLLRCAHSPPPEAWRSDVA